jgi:hypothetical protein
MKMAAVFGDRGAESDVVFEVGSGVLGLATALEGSQEGRQHGLTGLSVPWRVSSGAWTPWEVSSAGDVVRSVLRRRQWQFNRRPNAFCLCRSPSYTQQRRVQTT